jgi:hypothetical protein
MKYRNPIQFLFNEADENADLGGDGLSSRLEKFIGENKFDASGAVIEEEVSSSTKPIEVAAPVESAKTDDKPNEQVAVNQEEEEEEFPALGEKKASEGTKPDLDFDAQTEAVVKAIEAQGHPGDEYKRLRAELKTLKDKKPIADLDSIPEVQELKQKAAEADKFKAEAEALRERQRELLKVNDEVAVKESDEFIEQVRKPIAAMEGVVKQIAESAEIDAETLFSIITETSIAKQDKMLEALHDKVGSRMAGRIERFCDDYKAIESKGSAMLADAGKNAERARLAREQSIREEQTRKEELFKVSVESSFTNYAKRIPGFTDSTGNLTDVAHAAMAKTAAVDVSTLGPDDLGYMAFAANALPEARKAIVALQKELAILKGSKPAPKALEGKTAPPPEKDDEFMGLADRMKGMEFTFTPPT